MLKTICFLSVLASGFSEEWDDCSFNFEGGRGDEDYVQNVNFDYEGENHCRWTVTTDLTSLVHCEIEIPRSRNCTADSLTIEGQINSANRKFCGDGPIDLTATGPVLIKLDSGQNSVGGKFWCRIETHGTTS